MALDPRAKFLITAATDFSKASSESKTFLGSLQKTAKVAVAAVGAAATVAAAATLRLASDSAKSADALAKQADILGITTQKMAAYQLAARLSGSSNDGFEKGLRKLQKSIVDATNGMTTYTRAFDALKLDPEELKALTPDKQFEALGQAFAGVETQIERVVIAYDLFGGKNTALLNTLVTTGTQLNQIERDTKAWGIALTRVDARQIEQANDAVERAKTATAGIGTSIALALAPLRKDVANSFADAASEANGFKAEIQATMEALVFGANFAANTVRGIQVALLGAKLASLSIQESLNEKLAEDGWFKRLLELRSGNPGADYTRSTAAVDAIRAEMDETAAAMETLVGKFQDGEAAVAQFRDRQQQAIAAAKDSLQSPGGNGNEDDGEDTTFFGDAEKAQLAQRLQAVQQTLLSESEAMRAAYLERQAIVQENYEAELIGDEERNAITVQLAQEHAKKLIDIDKKRVAEQQNLEHKHQSAMTSLRSQAVGTAISLLHQLGARSKTIARAAIIAEKAYAVTRIIIQTNIAAAKALAELGPIAGPPAALKIKAWGYGLAAATTALGIAQVASVGQGSTGTTIGTPSNPVFTDSSSTNDFDEGASQSGRNVVNITINGDVNGDQAETVITRIQELVEEQDVVIFSAESHQGLALQGG